MAVTQDTPSRASAHPDAIALALSSAVIVTLAELLRGIQRPYWFGSPWRQWGAAFLAFLGYFVVFWALTEILALIIRSTTRHRATPITATTLGAFVSGPLVWSFVCHGANTPFHAFRVFVTLALALHVALADASARARRSSVRFFALRTAFACVSAMACIPFATRIVFYRESLAPLRTMLPLVWAVVAGSCIHTLFLPRIFTRRSRHMRRLAVLLIGVSFPIVLFVISWLPAPSLHAGVKGPNVLLITADAMRAKSLSLYGGPVHTPALQALAARGHLFKRAYSLAPWTVPSFCGLFSSKYPPGTTPHASADQRNREQNSYDRLYTYWLDNDGMTLPEHLAYEKGYSTFAFIGNMALFRQAWLLKAFRQKTIVDALTFSPRGVLDLFPTTQAALDKVFPSLCRIRTPDTTRTLCGYAIQYLKENRNNNFFLWVHFMDPHVPYDPPEAYRTKRARQAKPPWDQFPPRPEPFNTNFASALTNNQIQLVRDLYRGEIRYVDWAIGRILGELNQLGLGKNTYVVFSADHGEELFERGRNGHGFSLFDELVHVPLIIAGPGIPPGQTTAPVSHIDLIPTLADLLGVKPQSSWRGVSLAPVLRSRQAPEPNRPCFAQATDFLRYKPDPQQMVVSGNLKLIRDLETGQLQLYNLAQDPQERTNLAASHPKDRDRLLQLLDNWSRSFPSTFDKFHNQRAVSPTVPDAVKRTLESLGYLDTK